MCMIEPVQRSARRLVGVTLLAWFAADAMAVLIAWKRVSYTLGPSVGEGEPTAVKLPPEPRLFVMSPSIE